MSHPSSSPQQHHCEAEELLRFIKEGNLRHGRALEGGADIDGGRANLDYPPLELAAEDGLVKMVKFLLRRGANLDVAAPRDVPCCSDDQCSKLRLVSGEPRCMRL